MTIFKFEIQIVSELSAWKTYYETFGKSRITSQKERNLKEKIGFNVYVATWLHCILS